MNLKKKKNSQPHCKVHDFISLLLYIVTWCETRSYPKFDIFKTILNITPNDRIPVCIKILNIKYNNIIVRNNKIIVR